MKIGRVAQLTGVSVRSLRYYEERGLILARRTAGGQRVYDDDVVERVELIQLLFAAGVSSRDVEQILPCIHSGTTTPEMVHRLDVERARIDDRLRELTSMRDRLDGVLAEASARLAEAG